MRRNRSQSSLLLLLLCTRSIGHGDARWGFGCMTARAANRIAYPSDDAAHADLEAQWLGLLLLPGSWGLRGDWQIEVTRRYGREPTRLLVSTDTWIWKCGLLVGMLVSKTVPSSRDPVYQQLTVSPFLGKLVLSPFFSTDLKYLGGPFTKQHNN